jgi:serine/threonine-protein kinase
MPYAQQLGRYQLLDRIAFGGMAEIFRAKTFDHEGRAHLVAVKRVLNHLTTDDDFLRMLVDEAKITATLSHENIARVYEFAVDHGAAGDEYFIAMEYVDGKDVRTLLDRHRAQQQPIPPEHVAWIGMEVGHALHAAHTQKDGAGWPLNIVHRDVSPSNVLLSYRGEVKLCDFGIAKAATTRVQTKTGVIKGKVKYMSPEQAMGRKLDHRSDLFSLGTVMYEMLTLAAPFSAATEVELIFAVRDARKRDARAVEPAVPEELDQLLNRLMSRSRSQRFQSGAELALALRLFLDRYRPGYRRSHFGRFMRATFEADIERELRQLEEYVIDGGDPDKVGENLIADALGHDAPYTKFTAAGGSRASTGNFPRVDLQQSSPDLHAEPTRILTRSRGGAADMPEAELEPEPSVEAPLAEQSTQILDPARPRLHELPTGPKQLPDLHAQETRLFDFAEPESLHAQETRILQRSALASDGGARREEATVVLDDRRGRRDDDVDTNAPTAVPEQSATTEPHPRVVLDDETPETETAPPRERRDTRPSGFDESEDSTAVPLDDESTAVPLDDASSGVPLDPSALSLDEDSTGVPLDDESTMVPLDEASTAVELRDEDGEPA